VSQRFFPKSIPNDVADPLLFKKFHSLSHVSERICIDVNSEHKKYNYNHRLFILQFDLVQHTTKQITLIYSQANLLDTFLDTQANQ
jgi:hypothetical protein